jgi:hypothetical protein
LNRLLGRRRGLLSAGGEEQQGEWQERAHGGEVERAADLGNRTL